MVLEVYAEKLFEITKTKIVNLAKTELDDIEKKERLDEWVEEQALNLLDLLPIGVFLKWVIKKYLVPVIPTITQAIYDLLKAKIEGVTRA